MKVGLVGFQGSGKTSVFNALTGQRAETGLGKKAANLDRIKVPDERVDRMSALYSPKKTTHAVIDFVDVAGPAGDQRSESGLEASLVAQIREADALVHVVRAFDSAMLTRAPDPARDIITFDDELILTDLVQVENRLGRLRKEAKKTPELELMGKLEEALNTGKALRRITLEEHEKAAISGFRFLSQKPVLVVVNLAEGELSKGLPAAAVAAASERELEAIALSALVEAEIQEMEPADQAEFLRELGLSEPARSRFIHAAYHLLDLISFLTVGEDEVRAWTIKRGTPARAAAGKIHSDLERGFIRAEVIPYEALATLGSEAKVKEAGKFRLEGKDYIVQDGDIMHVRHSG
ncbi:MAG: redox-regulated ATPase YchF [Deltaproteobacteria bacterium]|nr:redox-regulated ATPase YchF [Deltaproteobacteria bacterium]